MAGSDISSTEPPLPSDFGLDVVRGSTPAEATVYVRGELDVATSGRLDNQLDELLTDGVRHLVVDVTDMTFVDSTGLGALVGAVKRANQAGGGLVLRHPSVSTKKVLEISGLSRLIDIID